ncbi:MAG: hypothetical protein M3Y87_06135 [Myxococcota bacterium]|nr:hypothetical protein [Myxococcota bacterium]
MLILFLAFAPDLFGGVGERAASASEPRAEHGTSVDSERPAEQAEGAR